MRLRTAVFVSVTLVAGPGARASLCPGAQEEWATLAVVSGTIDGRPFDTLADWEGAELQVGGDGGVALSLPTGEAFLFPEVE